MPFSILLQEQTGSADFAMQMTETAVRGEISFLSMFLKGGYILIPIVLLSFVSVYLIIRKYLEIRRNFAIDPGYVEHFNSLVLKGNLQAARQHLQLEQTSYSRIFRYAVEKAGQPVKDIESAVESASNIEVARVSRHMGYLGLIAGIAPMLGFIGTISGIIKIFYNISLSDNISIGIISEGLYEKMISSGSGLIVGIIAFTGYHMLNMQIDRFITRVEAEAFEIIHTLSKSMVPSSLSNHKTDP